uniref:Pre-mRNA-splicing factor cwc15 n=1 Tax=Schistosoma japonicum TaxID=6182 RepID=C1LHQ3_SCHJA|nr:Pre-mRNA-splicing factor cwc15 [Schistosoma japonicum]
MTTAGRPTWDTAKGGRGKWEGDLSALSKQYSVRDLPAHTKLKLRQEGQGRPEDIQGKDFKRALEEKEKRVAQEKSGRPSVNVTSQQPAITSAKRPSSTNVAPSMDSSTIGSIKRARPETTTAVSTTNLDADDPWDEDYDEDQDYVVVTKNSVHSKTKNPTEDNNNDGFGGGDDNEDADNDDADDDDEDEEMLLAELAKIKRERAEEAARLAAERKAAEETIRMENILKGNPLLNSTNSSEFKVKRRWDDDVVFKNCARGEVDHIKRGFVNDTLRSEFHKKFMKKYIQ